MTAQSDHYPGSEYVPVFPAGAATGAWHGSGLETPSGRFMYVYSVITAGLPARPQGECRVAFYNDFNKLAHEATVNEDLIGQFFDGEPDEDLLIFGGPGVKVPVQTLWRHPDGRTFLNINYGFATDDVADDTPDTNLIDVWISPSGEGTDWAFYSNIQTDSGDGISGFADPDQRIIGATTVTPSGDWVVPGSIWQEGNSRMGVFHSPNGGAGWSVALNLSFGLVGGIYGAGATRAIVEDGSGGLVCTAWSHTVELDDPNGQYRIAHGSPDGSSWSVTPDHQAADIPPYVPWAANLLGQNGGEVTRINRGRLESSSTPITGPWAPVVDVKQGRFDGSPLGQSMLNAGNLWMEVRPGTWVLFSHDKAWFVFGGWLVGALGHS